MPLPAEGSTLPVDFLAMPHPHHQDQEDVVLNLIDDAVVPEPEAVKIIGALELLHSCRSRIFGQRIYSPHDPALIRLRDFFQRLERRRFDLDAVGHDLRLSPLRNCFLASSQGMAGPSSLSAFLAAFKSS